MATESDLAEAVGVVEQLATMLVIAQHDALQHAQDLMSAAKPVLGERDLWPALMAAASQATDLLAKLNDMADHIAPLVAEVRGKEALARRGDAAIN